MGPGVYDVKYIAMDSSGNEAECNFIIEVKGMNNVLWNICKEVYVIKYYKYVC